MSVCIDTHRWKYELKLRCMSRHDLAKLAGVSDATVSAAFAERPIAEISFKLMVDVLERTPVSEFMKRLVGPYVPPPADEDSREGLRSEHEA
jgi:Bacterial regulatory proteins, lacI family